MFMKFLLHVSKPVSRLTTKLIEILLVNQYGIIQKQLKKKRDVTDIETKTITFSVGQTKSYSC